MWVPSLIGELRFHMLKSFLVAQCDQKPKQTNENTQFFFFFVIYFSKKDWQGFNLGWLKGEASGIGRSPEAYCLECSSGSDDKESVCNAGDPGPIPGSGRSPGEGNGNPLQYSCLENPMDRGAWWAIVCGVAESQT